MATQLEVREGIRAIRKIFSDFGKSGSRIHRSAMEDHRQRLRALEGLCGGCKNLTVVVEVFAGRPRAQLRCLERNSPIDLFRNTGLGEEAKCPDYRAI